MKIKNSIKILIILTLFSFNIYSFNIEKPLQWSETVTGVKTKIKTKEKIIALTFDACGVGTDSYDKKLIDFLIKNKIKATLFITGKWIKKFPDIFKYLSKISLFDIQNHGLNHKPCSVNGKSIYGIKGTKNKKELINEIVLNAKLIKKLTNKKTEFFRSGTAYYDEIAVKIINKLNHQVIGFSILGDAGATFSKEQVYKSILKAKHGDIIILHMNRPEKESSIGAMKAILKLQKKGFKFVKLKNYKDKLI